MDDKQSPAPEPAKTQPSVTQQTQVAPAETAPAQTETVIPSNTESKPSKKKRLLIPIIAVAVLLFGAGAAAYNILVINDPDTVWADALDRTARGLDGIVNELQENEGSGPQKGTISGDFNVAGSASASGELSGSYSSDGAQLTAAVNTTGLELDAEIRVINDTEDAAQAAYIKVDGLEQLSVLLGFVQPQLVPLLQEVNNQWYEVSLSDVEELSGQAAPTVDPEALQNSYNELSRILRDTLFSTNPDIAVLSVSEYVGREDFDGDSTFLYKVQLQEQQTIDMINQISEFLLSDENSALREGLGINEADLTEQVNELIADASGSELFNQTANVWVDADNRFIRNIRITTNSSEGTQTFDFGLDYEGGDEFPFILGISADDTTGESIQTLFGLSLNRDTKAISASANVNYSVDGNELLLSANVQQTPDGDVQVVERPENAQDLQELLSGLLLGGIGTGSPGGFSDDSFDFEFDTTPIILDDVEL